MPAADLPPDEEARLRALRELELLDTEPEAEFDELVRRAAAATDAPIAVITLVDEARQWFKARVNLEMESSDRDVSFCAHAILTPDDLTIVPDTLEDERFNDNLLVTEDPNIRFYAGAPIFTPDGHPVGTLCVIDAAPRNPLPLAQLVQRFLADAVVQMQAMPALGHKGSRL